MSLEVDLGGRALVLDPAGVLVDPASRLLVVADLHFETGSAYARRGALLPPYDTMATLARLELLVRRWRPRTVVSLGDGFHDRHGPDSLSPACFDVLRMMMQGREWVWITGNHDPVLPLALGGAVLAELDLDGLTLRHLPGAAGGTLRAEGGEIAAHMHPRGRVAGRRLRASRPCFVGNGRRLVMPAFGSYAGGLNALDPAMRAILGDSFDAWLLGDQRVFKVPHTHLVADPVMYRTGLISSARDAF